MKIGINIDNFLIDVNKFLLNCAPKYMKIKYNLLIIDENANNIDEMFGIKSSLEQNFPSLSADQIERYTSDIIDDFWTKYYLKYLRYLMSSINDDIKETINDLYSNDNEIYLIDEEKFIKNGICKNFAKTVFEVIISKCGLKYHKLVTFNNKKEMIEGIQRRRIVVLADNRTEINNNASDCFDVIKTDKRFNFSESIDSIIKNNNKPLLSEPYKLTDSPSKDKIWLKHYKIKDTKYTLDRKHPYERMHDMHIDYTNGPVFKYSKTNKELKAKELFENIAAYATWLKAKGVKKGDKIPVIALNTFDAIEISIALMTIGAVIVPIAPTDSKELIMSKILSLDSKPSIMYIGDFYNPKNNQHLAPIIEEISSKIGIKNVIYSKLDIEVILNSLKDKIKNGHQKESGHHEVNNMEMFNAMFTYRYKDNFINIKELKKMRKNNITVDYSGLSKDLDDTAAIIFTSGNTPKGVELTYRNIDAELVQYYNSILNLKRNDKISCFLPFDHVFGLVIGIMVTISTGMTGVLDPAFDRKKIGNLVYDDQIDYLTTIPGLLTDLLNDSRTLNNVKNKLRKVFCGSQVLPENTFLKMNNEFPNNKIVDGYGSSEGCCVTLIDGMPILNGDFKIVNIDTNDECNYYQTGEMCISHEVIFKKYHNMPELTNSLKKIHADGKLWYHTGDLAYFNKDGRIIYQGRVINDFIKSNGHQVYLYKIKSLVESHKDVKECLVIGREDIKKGHVPVLFVRPIDENIDNNELHDQLMEMCNRNLEYYEYPNSLFVVDKFPLGNRGKVNISFINDNYDEIINNNYAEIIKVLNDKKSLKTKTKTI